MTTPDTQQDEETFVAALEDAFAAAEHEDGLPEGTVLTDLFMEHLRPALAAIRRQAAAEALTEQASAFDRQAGFFVKQQNAMLAKGDHASADVYTEYVDHGHRAATKLRQAAADKLAEGYEWQCASGRGCDTPVPDAGDECARCHAEGDDENYWEE
jgi:hypothetical protein